LVTVASKRKKTIQYKMNVTVNVKEHAVACLSHYTTSRNVTNSNLDKVIAFFGSPNTSRRKTTAGIRSIEKMQ
jgi:hypothetical protein